MRGNQQQHRRRHHHTGAMAIRNRTHPTGQTQALRTRVTTVLLQWAAWVQLFHKLHGVKMVLMGTSKTTRNIKTRSHSPTRPSQCLQAGSKVCTALIRWGTATVTTSPCPVEGSLTVAMATTSSWIRETSQTMARMVLKPHRHDQGVDLLWLA